MSAHSQNQLGGCRCGQVRFKVEGKSLITMACHCTGCQRMTASAFSLSALYPAIRFEITAGDPVIGGLHGPTRHFFCPHCMSWLFTRPDDMDEFVNVRATMLDDVRSYRPFIETYTGEALQFPVPKWVVEGMLKSSGLCELTGHGRYRAWNILEVDRTATISYLDLLQMDKIDVNGARRESRCETRPDS